MKLSSVIPVVERLYYEGMDKTGKRPDFSSLSEDEILQVFQ